MFSKRLPIFLLTLFVFAGFTVLAMADTILIDFESFPGPDGVLGTADDVAAAEGNTVSDQYLSLGVLFSLIDGSAPTIIFTSSYIPESPLTLQPVNAEDWAAGKRTESMQDIIIDFTTPVSRVKISSLDTDEPVTLRAFNAGGDEIASDIPGPGEWGDMAVADLEVIVDGSQGFISKVVVDLTQFDGTNPDSAGPEFYDLLEYDPTVPVIDIKPGSEPNSINLKSKGVIPVAILSTDDFDATTVNGLTVRFGPSLAVPVHDGGHLEDVNEDGQLDWVGHFKTRETGLSAGDTEASISGVTQDGLFFTGTDSVNIVGKAAPALNPHSKLTTTWASMKAKH